MTTHALAREAHPETLSSGLGFLWAGSPADASWHAVTATAIPGRGAPTAP
jgi:hypothetical protein